MPSAWTTSTPCRWWPSTATRPGPTCPAGSATTWWRSTGAASATGPVGGDLGYYALSAKEELEPLLAAYVAALPPGLASEEQATLGARLTAVYTALSRAEWALARVAPGEGALAGKFTHPSVAPYLRALQRLYPQVEALL